MGSFSIWHWMLFGAVALLLFGGKGKISDIMGDVAKGVKSFKKGLADDDDEKAAPAPPRQVRRARSTAGSESTPTTFTRSAERVLIDASDTGMRMRAAPTLVWPDSRCSTST